MHTFPKNSPNLLTSDLHHLNEMASIGYINKRLDIEQESDMKICVFSGEGPIPHLHILSKNQSETCVKLEAAEYFAHGKKRGIISTPAAIWLDQTLRQLHPNQKLTLWEFAIALWNSNNPKYKVSYALQQPDYTKLNS